jgi:hypothetical protein
VAVGEQVRRRAVDELVALLGDLREEARDDALAHDAAGDRDLLEEDVLDALGLDPARDLLDLLAAPGLVASLLERRRRRGDARAGEDGFDRAAELTAVDAARRAGGLGCHLISPRSRRDAPGRTLARL